MAIVVNRSVTSGEANVKAEMLDLFYPVGSYYYTSDTNFNPNTAWGGTWTEDAQGRVLVGQDTGTFSTINDTGGEETHTLVTSEIPSHSHDTLYDWQNQIIGTGAGSVGGGYINDTQGYGYGSVHTGTTGSDGAHNNLQPYKVVKIWHRTA